MSKWISVKDKLPPIDRIILIRGSNDKKNMKLRGIALFIFTQSWLDHCINYRESSRYLSLSHVTFCNLDYAGQSICCPNAYVTHWKEFNE